MQRLNSVLNTVMGVSVGMLIGRALYTVWNYKTNPGFYAMQSAPWYTGILVKAAFSAATLLICIAIKFIAKLIFSKRQQNK